ncbi:hypothetical protein L3X38_017087 [Prunus dulcis]|uniref:Secreted protein n=1 Tax=Prunus dulcis TaxID=3755 RepID=A0AAD4W915_PRUDU|nr:hypothetical protein L3X38_017087 [Prunus dulcis]
MTRPIILRHAILMPLAPSCLGTSPFKHASFVSPSAPSCLGPSSCDMQFLCLWHRRAQPHHPVTCNFVPSATPSPSAPSCQVLSLPNVLLTRGLGGLWVVYYTAWKMNYGVARPVHLKLQVSNQEVPSYSRTWGTTVGTVTDRATS